MASGVVLLVLAAAGWAGAFGTKKIAPNQVDALHAACVKDMIASTCKVMGTSSGPAAQSPKPGDLVFIAGVGAIAATDYQTLYAAGDAMCAVVRQACMQNWDGAQCITARKVLRRTGS